MKVLHVYRTYFPDPPGGLQEAIRQICIATKPLGVESTIFALSSNPEPPVIQRPEGRVVRYRSWAEPASCNLGGISAIRGFSELAREAELIHYHFPWPFADLLNALVRPRVPAVMTYHSDIVRQLWLGRAYAPLMKRMLKSMVAIVATSPAYAESSEVLSAPALRSRVRVIPLGINEESYPKHGNDAVLDRLGLDEREPFFLFIGVLRYYKGLRALIDAAGLVRARVVIAGSGPERAALHAQAGGIGLTNIVFAGQVTDEEKVALLTHCRALVLPSHMRSEAFGMVLVEAAMFGKPTISCEIETGTSYVNADKETGFVVKPENPGELAAAMNRLLDNENLARNYGQAARLRYERLFSGQALGSAYAALYRDLVQDR